MTTVVKKPRHQPTFSERLLDVFKVLFLLIVVIVTIYPIWNIFVVSLNDATDAVRGGIYFYPRVFSIHSYREILGRLFE